MVIIMNLNRNMEPGLTNWHCRDYFYTIATEANSKIGEMVWLAQVTNMAFVGVSFSTGISEFFLSMTSSFPDIQGSTLVIFSISRFLFQLPSSKK